MSRNGEMGAIERFQWLLPDGDTMIVTVDRGKLAQFLAVRMRESLNGRASIGFGAVVAKREKTK